MASNDKESTSDDAMSTQKPVEPPAGTGARKNRSSIKNRKYWINRKSIYGLRKEMLEEFDIPGILFENRKQDFRLSDLESVTIGGLIAVEAFTPSTIAELKRRLAKSPWRNLLHGDESWSDIVQNGRTASGGWRQIAVVSRPEVSQIFDGFSDPLLPEGVDLVSVQIQFPTPSLTLLVAIFYLQEDFGDVSEMLRCDLQRRPPTQDDIEIFVEGRLGRLRAKVPWVRPLRYRARGPSLPMISSYRSADYYGFLEKIERACLDWFSSNFSGHFSMEPHEVRPIIRIVITEEEAPMAPNNSLIFRTIGLGSPLGVWRSAQQPGWVFRMSDGARRSGSRAVLACRRCDAVKPTKAANDPSRSSALIYNFCIDSLPMVSAWAVMKLIENYAQRLASLRDGMNERLGFRRTIRQSHVIDDYLVGDGLDASTIASELAQPGYGIHAFLTLSPRYVEDISYLPPAMRGRYGGPRKLNEMITSHVRNTSQGILRDTKAATDNFIASAGIRQSIANIRIQWIVVGLSLLALAVAAASLVVAAKH